MSWSKGYDCIFGESRVLSASTKYERGFHHILFMGYAVVRPPHHHSYFTWNPKTGLWGETVLTSADRVIGPPQRLTSASGALVTRIDATFLPERETYAMRFVPVAPTSDRSSTSWTALSRIKHERRRFPGTFGESGLLDVRLWPEGFTGQAGTNTIVLPLGPKTPTQLSVEWLKGVRL